MLPAPNLDDRHFQGLVDEAKRLVHQRCPDWTDHNVSDPGVTLIEAFAQMVDQLIYRLNRVPDLHYVKFLEMIGVQLRPPAPARGPVTCWLSAPQPQPVVVRAETEVATPRTDVHEPLVFATATELTIIPCSFEHAAVHHVGGTQTEVTAGLLGPEGFRCFSDVPVPNDVVLIGLSAAVPSCAVNLRLGCRVSGRGVDPRRPPVVWEAWTSDDRWQACDVEQDGTGGLNRAGDVILHVPPRHVPSVIARQRAGWLRCRVVATEADQPAYTASPTIQSVSAFTVGGTVEMAHAEVVRDEVVGRSDGTPGQRFRVQRRPVVPFGGQRSLSVIEGEEEQRWEEVPDFAGSRPTDRHFRVDAYSGDLFFGPAVRTADGTLRSYGATPPAGAVVRIHAYRTGGGRVGNVARGQIRVLKSSVPYVARVENRAPAVGGADAEDLEDAKVRGPLLLRSRGRAVTAEDFEQLTRDLAPEIARVHCVTETGEPGGVRVLVVPSVVGDRLGAVRLPDLAVPPEILERIASGLDRCRLVGTRVLVQPPQYVGLTAVVSVSARPLFDPTVVHDDVLRALVGLFHPLTGGLEGRGWPFGRTVQLHEVHAALSRLPGVDLAREVQVSIYPADPTTGARGSATQRLEIPATALVHSFDHQVRVQR